MRFAEQRLTQWRLGQQDGAEATAYRPGEAPVIQNFRIAPDGTLELRSGSRKKHVTALNGGEPCFGATTFIPSGEDAVWVYAFGDTLYYSDDFGATSTQIATSLREDYWDFATINVGGTNYLLAVNGGTKGYSWDGSSWAELAGSFPEGVTSIEVYNGRVWFAGHAGPLVQAGRIGVIDEFTGSFAISVQCQTHDGDRDVNALFSIGNVLLAFKRGSVSWIDGFGQTDIVVAAGARGLSRSVGCIAPDTITAVGDQGCMWLSERGVEFYQPGAGIRLISQSVRRFFNSIALADIVANPGGPTAVWMPNQKEGWLAIPAAGGQNDHIVRVHFDHPTPEGGFATTIDPLAPTDGGTLYIDDDGILSFSENHDRNRVRVIEGDLVLASGFQAGNYTEIDGDGVLSILTNDTAPARMFVSGSAYGDSSVPISGSYDGFLKQMELGVSDNETVSGTGGATIQGRVLGPPALFGDPFEKKWGRKIEAQVTSPQAANVDLLLLANGVEVSSKTKAVTAAVGDQPVEVEAKVSGKAESLQVEFRATTPKLRLAGLNLWAGRLRKRF